MPTEIERKFLVRDLREALAGTMRSEPIRQGYLAIDPAGVEVRVRDRGGRTVMTVKSGAGLVRDEVELDIATETFERLWGLTAGRRVAKVRHYADVRGVLAEIDVFEEELEGLVVVEAEFGSKEEALAFEAPDWFGRELTGDKRYSNAALARDGAPVA